MPLNHKKLIVYPAKRKGMFYSHDENKTLLDFDIFRQSFQWNTDT